MFRNFLLPFLILMAGPLWAQEDTVRYTDNGWQMVIAGEFTVAQGQYWFTNPPDAKAGGWFDEVEDLVRDGYNIRAHGLTVTGASFQIWQREGDQVAVVIVLRSVFVHEVSPERLQMMLSNPEAPPPKTQWERVSFHQGPVHIRYRE